MAPSKTTVELPSPDQCGPIKFTSHAQEQNFINSRMAKLLGFRRKVRPLMPEVPPIYIFNVSDQELVWREPGFPRLVVPPCKPGQEYSDPLVLEGMYLEEYLEDRSTEFNIYNGVEIAFAILKVGPGMKGILDERNRGFFLSRTNPPHSSELAEAKAKYAAYCDALIAEADAIFREGISKGVNGQMINEGHRRAAAYRRQTRDWAKAVVEMKDCPFCFKPIPAVAAVHYGTDGCGGVIDWPKAVRAGLKSPEQMAVALSKTLEEVAEILNPGAKPKK